MRRFAVCALGAACALSMAMAGARAADSNDDAADGKAPATVPFWQAPPLPQAVIQGGPIPPGWQPQAVPYQGVGPDGRPVTMYFAPTYVFTYQAGPPVLATPQVNRPGAPTAVQPALGAYGWNYRGVGAAPVPVSLPQGQYVNYRAAPYQFPPDARALAGTPITPPAGMPPAPPQSWGGAPTPMAQQALPPLPPAPTQWAPATGVPPPPGMVTPPGAPPPSGWTGVGEAAAVAAPFAAAAAMPGSPPPPTASLTPVAPVPVVAPLPTAPASVPAQPASVAGAPAALPPGASASNTHQWKVVAVYDGDTVTCIDENNQQQKIRLAEIDAPEAKQDFGQVSRQALASMVFGKTITVVDDGRDRYGRWIGRLYADGIDVNRQMVATGMAWHYAAYSKDSSLAALQAQAQAQRIGIWSQPNPVPPWEYRKGGKKAA